MMERQPRSMTRLLTTALGVLLGSGAIFPVGWTTNSYLTHPAIAQTRLKHKTSLEIASNPVLRWEGVQPPKVQMLKGKQSWVESIERIFQGGVWTFYSDGKFVFIPSPNANLAPRLFPLTGTYTRKADEIQFQAENEVNGTKITVDGSIRVRGKTATLEGLYTASGPFAQSVSQISQELSVASNTNSQRMVQGIPVPSVFEVALQGKTDNQSFGPLVAKLQITTPLKGDSNPFGVYLVAEPVDAVGSIQWSSFLSEQYEAYPIKINQGEVQIEIKHKEGAFPGVVWFTLTQGSLASGMPIGAAGQQGILRFKIAGDRISGEIQAIGKSDFIGQASTYTARFAGRRQGSTAGGKQNLAKQGQGITNAPLLAASDERSFAGRWKADIFGEIQLQQTGQQVQGTYTGRGGGTITGVVQGNRLDFTWKDAQQGEGWGFFRMIAEGQTLAGSWGRGTDKTQSNGVLATRVDVPAVSVNLTDKVALRDHAYDLVLKGRCNQAISPLETALTLYKQERGQQKTWKLLRDSYLIDELNILTRLAFCYHQLEDYEGLLQAFRYTSEVRALLQQIEYLQEFTIPPSDPVRQALESFLTDWRTRLASDLSKINFLEQGQPFFQTLTKSFVELQQYDQALVVAEQGRARALVDLLAARLNRSTIDPPDLAQIQKIAKAQNATLVQYAIVSDNAKNSDRKDSRKLLYTWVIQPSGKIAFHRTDLSQSKIAFAELVSKSREALGARGYDRSDINPELTPEAVQRQNENRTRNLRQLHQLLIEPIATFLPKDPNHRVIFIPQNELFLVPFPALLDTKGQFLIEQHTLLTAPSIQVLDLTRQLRRGATGQEPGKGGMLIVGDPTMPRIVTRAGADPLQLRSLPEAKQEAIAIAKLFNTQAITGKQATEREIVQQMPGARLIHLATHGLLDDFKGLGVPGAIALAPNGSGEINDGLLTANEILDMKLQAELVVLSACDTGRGTITGDGVIGLSRALITAGVPSIIVSLWQVPDDSTRFLMTQFYQNLQKTPDKAQALRQAMLTTKQKYPQPLDWAAFTLIGEAE